LECLGFCGADDSVDPRLLAAVSQRYNWVEWGVLFRDDKQGTPRFASQSWLDDLRQVNRSRTMLLAGHLCSIYASQLLNGDDSYVKKLRDDYGFQRFQLNATKANNFDSSQLGPAHAANLARVAAALPDLEFIVQRNDETRALWEGAMGAYPPNVSFLYDESKGTGSVLGHYPAPPPEGVRFGYTGGLGPANLRQQLGKMGEAAPGRRIWADMESSMRTKLEGGGDLFDVNKAMRCVRVVLDLGLKAEPA